jgi:hypothetical protein
MVYKEFPKKEKSNNFERLHNLLHSHFVLAGNGRLGIQESGKWKNACLWT